MTIIRIVIIAKIHIKENILYREYHGDWTCHCLLTRTSFGKPWDHPSWSQGSPSPSKPIRGV